MLTRMKPWLMADARSGPDLYSLGDQRPKAAQGAPGPFPLQPCGPGLELTSWAGPPDGTFPRLRQHLAGCCFLLFRVAGFSYPGFQAPGRAAGLPVMHAGAPAAPGAQLTLLCGVEGKTDRQTDGVSWQGVSLRSKGRVRVGRLPAAPSLHAGTQARQE